MYALSFEKQAFCDSLPKLYSTLHITQISFEKKIYGVKISFSFSKLLLLFILL